MSCDLEITNDSVHLLEKISSYIKICVIITALGVIKAKQYFAFLTPTFLWKLAQFCSNTPIFAPEC